MFGFMKKKPVGEREVFHISGMHCSSCSMNIDGALEDLDGVVESRTSYAKAETVVRYIPEKIALETLKKTIQGLGYSFSE
jgi:copper chaperone CopZ